MVCPIPWQAYKVNSYTLETLDEMPIKGLFNARRLYMFTPHISTTLALAQVEEVKGQGSEETEEEEDQTDETEEGKENEEVTKETIVDKEDM